SQCPSTQRNNGAKKDWTPTTCRHALSLSTAGYPTSSSRWRTVLADCPSTAPSSPLTAVSAHDCASTMPTLHSASTRTWGRLSCGSACCSSSAHWYTCSWQDIAVLLGAPDLPTHVRIPRCRGSCHPAGVRSANTYPCELAPSPIIGEGGARGAGLGG